MGQSIALHDVTVLFPGWPPVLRGLNLQVAPGEFAALVGASGSGKSTVLRVLAGLLTPDAGTIAAPGEFALMFQQPRLLPWRTVLDNVHLPAELRRQDRRRRARELLDLVGLGSYAQQRPSQLSGGQQQRVALARALLLEPALLLLDEPFAALDALTREELHLELLRIWRETGATCLFVTHDIAEAAFLADRVLVLGAGRVQQEFAVPLPRPRLPAHRYSPELSALCLQVRTAMEGVRAHG